MTDWLTEHPIPIGRLIKLLVDYLNDHAAWLFNFISLIVGTVIDGLVAIFAAVPAPLLLLVFVVLGYAPAALLEDRGPDPRGRPADHQSRLLAGDDGDAGSCPLRHLICMAVGVPVGIAAAHRPRLFAVLRPVLDLMQTIPTFVYLIPTLILFGLGVVPGLISTVIFALPSPIRLTHLGITSVPLSLIEAGEAFGATRRQLLFKIELPHAAATIMAGLTQCIMLSLSMVVIAALVGAGGLGKPVVRALNTVNIAHGLRGRARDRAPGHRPRPRLPAAGAGERPWLSCRRWPSRPSTSSSARRRSGRCR